MKLSAPQKRVLRTMYRHDCEIGEARFGSETHLRYEAQTRESAPRIATIRVLHRHGFLRVYRLDWFCSAYILTPKGREKAKELQDAETE